MDQSRKKVEGATGGAKIGATGGQQLHPYSPTGGELQTYTSEVQQSTSVTALQQRGGETVAIQNQVRHFQPILNVYTGPVFHGEVKGVTFIDKSSKITDSHIGHVDVSPSQSSRPHVQVMNTGMGLDALHIGSSEGGQEKAINDVFTALLLEIKLPDEVKQSVLDALQKNKSPTSGQNAIAQTASQAGVATTPSKEATIPTEKIMKSMENIQLGDNIEILLLEAFHALLRQDDSQKSTLMLITKFNEESTSLPASFYENHKDLKEGFEEFWEDFQLTLAGQTYQRHIASNSETISALARICAKLSTELLQRKEKSKTKLEEEKTFSSRARNVTNMGKYFFSNKKPIHAILTFYMAAELHKLANNGDDAIYGIATCSHQTCDVVKEIAKEEEMKSVILDHAIPIMRKMTDFIDSMQNSSHAVRVECKACCLYHIGFCYRYCGEDQQDAKLNENAIELMRTEFKDKANNYKIYGYCLNNAGAAYEEMGNITKAIELYKMALDAYENVTDWRSEEEKTEDIKGTEHNLRRNEAKLKK